MNWLMDYVPWWLWFLVAAGGTGALIAFVPGALALVVSVWNMLPKSVRWALLGVVAVLVAFLKGRNTGRANADAENKAKVQKADATRIKVERDVAKLSDKQVDDELRKKGDFRKP